MKEWFSQVFPEKAFIPLDRSHDLFRIFFKGLPKNADLKIETSQKRLPETVLTFVEQEKWPQGTYSFVGIKVKGRLACVASPICAMGWGRDEFGNWIPPISFRIRESAENVDENLRLASFAGGTLRLFARTGLKISFIQNQENALHGFRNQREGGEFLSIILEKKSATMPMLFMPVWV